jgi:hypothetical protein
MNKLLDLTIYITFFLYILYSIAYRFNLDIVIFKIIFYIISLNIVLIIYSLYKFGNKNKLTLKFYMNFIIRLTCNILLLLLVYYN